MTTRPWTLVPLLAACLPVAAQNKLTIYGVADLSVVRARAGDRGWVWQVRDGGLASSRLGISASEDLGGGLKAGFNIESQINLANGTGNTTTSTNQPSGNTPSGGFAWNRRSVVSLTTPYGELRLGRDYTSTFAPVYFFDPFGTVGVASATNFQAFYTPSVVPSTLVRASNLVAWQIPPTWLPGVYAYAQAAPAEGNGARFTGLGAGYRKAPWQVGLAWGRTRNPLGGSPRLSPDTTAPDNHLEVWSGGASYDFGGFRPMVLLHRQRFDRFGLTAATTESGRTVQDVSVGFVWDLGMHTFKAAWVRRDDQGTPDVDATQVGAGYAYRFSKRTTAYLTAVHIDNSAQGTFHFASSNHAPPAGQTGQALQAGLNVMF